MHLHFYSCSTWTNVNNAQQQVLFTLFGRQICQGEKINIKNWLAICMADLVTSSTLSKISARISRACSASSHQLKAAPAWKCFSTVQHLAADTWRSDWKKVLFDYFDDPDLIGHFSWLTEALVGRCLTMWSKMSFKRMSKSNLRGKKRKSGRKELNPSSKTNLELKIFNFNFFNFQKSATPTVEVSIGVSQQLFPVNVQTVYVVPSIAHVTLDPLHRVLLGQPASGGRARFHCSHLLLLLLSVLIVVGWGGGAGRRGGGGGGRGRWRGWRGKGRPLRKRVFPGSSSSFTARKITGKTQIIYFHCYNNKVFHFCKTSRKLYT